MLEGLLQVRSLGVNFYVLRDSKGLYLLDGGFIGGRHILRRALMKRKWDSERIVGIIVTHGHLDHILNVGRIAEETGAWIAAPRQDASHYEGCPLYHGAARITGCLEGIGRPLLGFRGARFESIKQCAEGLHSSNKIKKLGLDRYATSKFLNIVTTVELARRFNKSQTAFYCLDPGLMAGTGLARTDPTMIRFAWEHVLPIVARMLPDTSTPARSGAAAAWLMTTEPESLINGGIYSFDRQISHRCWDLVFDLGIGRRVFDESLDLMGIDHKVLTSLQAS